MKTNQKKHNQSSIVYQPTEKQCDAKLINKLFEENKRLKQENQQLKDLIAAACV